jgi:hypothetical protein
MAIGLKVLVDSFRICEEVQMFGERDSLFFCFKIVLNYIFLYCFDMMMLKIILF